MKPEMNPLLELPYGNASVPIPAAWRDWPVLAPPSPSQPAPPANDDTPLPLRHVCGRLLRQALENPIGMTSEELDRALPPASQVAIIVPDTTRRCGLPFLLPELLDWLAERGIPEACCRIVIALGIHRRMTPSEQEQLVGAEIMQRVRVLQPDVEKPDEYREIGRTSRSTPVQLFRPVLDADRIILLGSVTWHYFAGFGGGRKLLVPGVASRACGQANHLTAVDLPRGTRHPEASVGRLDGNPVHEDSLEAASLAAPALGINVLTDAVAIPRLIRAGHWVQAHRQACLDLAEVAGVPLPGGPVSVAVVSAGGHPGDINLVQAHKALDMASLAVRPGGVIVFVAECREGFGSKEMALFACKPGGAPALAEQMRRAYHSHAQTAHALREKTERFRVLMLSLVDPEKIHAMNMIPITSLSEAAEWIEREIGPTGPGVLMPWGAKYRPLP